MSEDRLLSALREIIREEMPQLTYGAVWEYSVTSVNDDGTINGVPTGDYPIPALNNVPQASLASGGVSTPTVGTAFLVEFMNMSGSIYMVITHEPKVRIALLDATEGMEIGPSASEPIELGPQAEFDVARLGDSIQIFFPVGLLNGVHSTEGPLVNYPAFIVTPAPGVITSGNPKVQL